MVALVIQAYQTLAMVEEVAMVAIMTMIVELNQVDKQGVLG